MLEGAGNLVKIDPVTGLITSAIGGALSENPGDPFNYIPFGSTLKKWFGLGGRNNENEYRPHHHDSTRAVEGMPSFELVEHRGKNKRGSIFRHTGSGILFYQDKRGHIHTFNHRTAKWSKDRAFHNYIVEDWNTEFETATGIPGKLSNYENAEPGTLEGFAERGTLPPAATGEHGRWKIRTETIHTVRGPAGSQYYQKDDGTWERVSEIGRGNGDRYDIDADGNLHLYHAEDRGKYFDRATGERFHDVPEGYAIFEGDVNVTDIINNPYYSPGSIGLTRVAADEAGGGGSGGGGGGAEAGGETAGGGAGTHGHDELFPYTAPTKMMRGRRYYQSALGGWLPVAWLDSWNIPYRIDDAGQIHTRQPRRQAVRQPTPTGSTPAPTRTDLAPGTVDKATAISMSMAGIPMTQNADGSYSRRTAPAPDPAIPDRRSPDYRRSLHDPAYRGRQGTATGGGSGAGTGTGTQPGEGEALGGGVSTGTGVGTGTGTSPGTSRGTGGGTGGTGGGTNTGDFPALSLMGNFFDQAGGRAQGGAELVPLYSLIDARNPIPGQPAATMPTVTASSIGMAPPPFSPLPQPTLADLDTRASRRRPRLFDPRFQNQGESQPFLSLLDPTRWFSL